ncbi:hypothetical protein BRADI_1g15615v3 [Brachypodium distachyon]|uniref:Uncharacterized protein n=1 Tax=Brachypodium distachyon TaxID=15368 RepID=A0A2K2DJN4_BRADI|nr:hypothetical protein BRADI_1g15615v3 [Brachypodium distachyon]
MRASHRDSGQLPQEIDAAINTLSPALRSRVYALKEGF